MEIWYLWHLAALYGVCVGVAAFTAFRGIGRATRSVWAAWHGSCGAFWGVYICLHHRTELNTLT